jgi:hypothetical protein
MTPAAEQCRSPIGLLFLSSPFDERHGPPFGGSFEQRDCATSAVMNGRTDEIVDIATTTVPR